MFSKSSTTLLLLCLTAVLVLSPLNASAQTPDADAIYRINVRTGPGATYSLITTLGAGTGLFLEARTANTAWLLVHTTDGARGWVAELYVGYEDGPYVLSLPVSDEILPAPAAPPSSPAANPSASANSAPPPDSSSSGDVAAGTLQAIFKRGQARGNNPRLVSYAGDCNSVSMNYLLPIAMGHHNAPEVNPAIAFFMPSFYDARRSAAAGPGYTAQVITDATFTPPGCPAETNPLTCEFATRKPSFIIVNFGINDILTVPDEHYIHGLSLIAELSKLHGVIPIFTTFPIRTDDHDLYETAIRFNGYVKGVAGTYGFPVIDLQAALVGYPNSGLQVDYIHLSKEGYHVWNHLIVHKLAQLYEELSLSQHE